MSSEVASAIARFHELLDNGHWQATHERLMHDAVERQLYSYAKPIARVLRPSFLTPERYAATQQASELVSRAVVELGERLRKDAALRQRLLLTPEEDARVLLEENPVQPYARLDGFVREDGVIRFMEYNPLGAIAQFADQMGQSFDAMPVMAEFRKHYRARYVPTQHRFLPACMRAYQQHGGTGIPNVAAVARPSDLEGMWSEWTAQLQMTSEAGIPLRIVEPSAIEVRGGRLFVGDFAIDCLTYLCERDPFFAAFPVSHPLWGAIKDSNIPILGSFSLGIVRGYKTAFALLSDREVVQMFAPEVREAVAKHVLWSRAVTECRTDFHGEDVDLLPFITRQRERFVLKPSDSLGGQNITLGWNCDAATWDAALQRALGKPHVVQERAVPSRSAYPVVIDGSLTYVEHNEDCDPYLWNDGEATGCSTRISSSEILNLQAEGTLTPMFIIERA
jgi:hypothetical protein